MVLRTHNVYVPVPATNTESLVHTYTYACTYVRIGDSDIILPPSPHPQAACSSLTFRPFA